VSTAVPWRSRIVGHDSVPPRELVPNPENWRSHPQAQRDALGGALEDVGWVTEVIVNRATGHLVDGHLRLDIALSRNEPLVPVTYVELTEDEERLVLATLDPLAAMADAEIIPLGELLAQLDPNNAALRGLLDNLADQYGLNEPKVGLTDPDDVPPLGEGTHIRRGDLFALGDHRLMCGDATEAGDVGRLMDGATPALMITDPPYGVEYDAMWRQGVHASPNRRGGAVSNDDRSDWTEAWRLSPSDVVYMWHGGMHAATTAASLEASGYAIRAQIIWVKSAFVFGRGAYHWRHEPCWYAVRDGANAAWGGSRSEDTVWEIDHLHFKSAETVADEWTDHSTQKPVECMARPLRNHAGDVYDPFLGSGTTIIAAEQLGRRCYAMDIDPRYVAVAIERWEKFTGRTSERLE
jgi:DNA modification methylase